MMNENKLSEYMMDRVYQVAEDIYANEISDDVPDLDMAGNPTREYLERFDYLSDNLKSAVKRASVALASEFKENGFEINPWYCENEIYDALRCFTK